MKNYIFLPLVFLFFMGVACSGKSAGINSGSGIYAGAPEWVIACELAFPISGAGSSCITNDDSAAFHDAEDNARSALYSLLNKKTRACISDFFRKNRQIEDEAFVRIADEIANVAKLNFKTAESWRSGNGCIFVLVVSDVDVIREAFKNKMLDFLELRKPDGFDSQNTKIMDDLEKYANIHFRKFRPL